MNLKEWAASQGISYATARRWYQAGKLPVPAYQAGRLIVISDPGTSSSRARALLAECLEVGLPTELAERIRQELAR